MTLFELVYLGLAPGMPVLHRIVRQRLRRFARAHGGPYHILDVGGRKSPYTIGVPAEITVTDIVRDSPVQERLNLGVTETMIHSLRRRRSNVARVLIDDMTCSALPDASFDCIVSVEVIEHVEEDRKFVREVARVLKPGGHFLVTTPNGDYVENRNPDHKRHYREEQLRVLLASCLDVASVEYAVVDGDWYARGLESWSLKHPWRTARSIIGNLVNGLQSFPRSVKTRPAGTMHLVALCRKS